MGREFSADAAKAALVEAQGQIELRRTSDESLQRTVWAHAQRIIARQGRVVVLDDDLEATGKPVAAWLLTQALDERVRALRSALAARPAWAPPLDIASLSPDALVSHIFAGIQPTLVVSPFVAETAVGPRPVPPDPSLFRTVVAPLRFLQHLVGGRGKREEEMALARQHDADRLGDAEDAFRLAVHRWTEAARAAEAAHEAREEARAAAVHEQSASLIAWEAAVRAGQSDAVVHYVALVLATANYPDALLSYCNLSYNDESKLLVVEAWLPAPETVPGATEFVYVKSKNEVRMKARSKAEIADLYRSAVASVTLRLVRDLFAAVPVGVVDVITVNSTVQAVDPATGKDVRPCLVSVRVTREAMQEVRIESVDPVACLAGFGAALSRRPEELAPVRPLIEFDMTDRRFVAGGDVLATLEGLDERPNVMDLTPTAFEELVTNLFTRMGLDAKLTRSSRDGGVDCVAYDPRPVLGGKVVIQAKRYRHTVGVSAVRDLYGTMLNEGANKGILVTTAGYGPDAFKFAQDKPIELIDGGNLLYMLEQHGVAARIVMPTE